MFPDEAPPRTRLFGTRFETELGVPTRRCNHSRLQYGLPPTVLQEINTRTDSLLPAEPLRYHEPGPDALFRPIAFGFVTTTMCAEILEERHRILAIVPRSRLWEQIVLFERYDPQHSAERFQALRRPLRGDGASLRMA